VKLPSSRNPDKGVQIRSNKGNAAAKRPTRLAESEVAALAAHITERDRRIALDCYEHHVLTTDQLWRLHFTHIRGAEIRLRQLYELRVLERFRPQPKVGEGSRPYHWILDEAGALLVADWKGIDRSELRYTRDDGLRLAGSRNLTHHVEANEFFVRLAVEAHRAGGELREWFGVRTLAYMFSGVVVPDGYGVLVMPGAPPLHVLLELDRATEAAQVLHDKAKRYAETLPHSSLRDLHPFVILAAPTTRRARSASTAVANTAAPLSVTVWNRETHRSLLATVTHCALDARSDSPDSERANL
jgi:hypothetical protein